MPNKRLIVIKVGSNTLTNASGRLDLNNLRELSDQLAVLHRKKYNIILVSSGAIVAGTERLKLNHSIKTMPEKQAAASVGQSLLINEYNNFLEPYGISLGQILMTSDELRNENKAKNLKNTFYTLLKLKVIPIVNENDSVAVDEIKVGDNDTLSAHVAILTKAKMLIILTDSEGLHTKNPHKDKKAKLITEVKKVTPEIEKLASSESSPGGVGGMLTKVKAAKMVNDKGIPLIIAHGRKRGILNQIVEGKKVGTYFHPKK
ncbi:MAG: glutamate 5-kinase [Candidatus Margulisbacteria bacterium]|nr:glutamate 5-kinase [Candidatus Margulisiibacteriota bacterium]